MLWLGLRLHIILVHKPKLIPWIFFGIHCSKNFLCFETEERRLPLSHLCLGNVNRRLAFAHLRYLPHMGQEEILGHRGLAVPYGEQRLIFVEQCVLFWGVPEGAARPEGGQWDFCGPSYDGMEKRGIRVFH